MGKKVLNIVVNSPSGPKQTCSKARNDDDNIDDSDDEGDLDNDGLDHKTNTEELFKVEKERKRNYKQRFCLIKNLYEEDNTYLWPHCCTVFHSRNNDIGFLVHMYLTPTYMLIVGLK